MGTFKILYVMQQLFLANACRDPRIKFLFCKYGLRTRINVSQLPREPPFLEVMVIDRVLAERVRRAGQRSASRSTDYDDVIQIIFSHGKFPSLDQPIDMLDGLPDHPGKVKDELIHQSNIAALRVGTNVPTEKPRGSTGKALSKKIRSRFYSGPDSHTARGVHPAALPSWTVIAAVKLPTVAR
jgi:hypothetical protein